MRRSTTRTPARPAYIFGEQEFLSLLGISVPPGKGVLRVTVSFRELEITVVTSGEVPPGTGAPGQEDRR